MPKNNEQGPRDDIDQELAALLAESMFDDHGDQLFIEEQIAEGLPKLNRILPVLERHGLTRDSQTFIDKFISTFRNEGESFSEIEDVDILEVMHILDTLQFMSPDSSELVDAIASFLSHKSEHERTSWLGALKDILGMDFPSEADNPETLDMLISLGSQLDKEQAIELSILRHVHNYVARELEAILPAHDSFDAIVSRLSQCSVRLAAYIDSEEDKDEEFTLALADNIEEIEETYLLSEDQVRIIRTILYRAAFMRAYLDENSRTLDT